MAIDRKEKYRRSKEYYSQHPEARAKMLAQQNAKVKEAYWRDPGAGRARSRDWYRRNRENLIGRNATRRAEVIAAYGGRCLCCGETEPKFLTIDHFGLSRRQHVLDAGCSVYADLKRRGWPKDHFRLLCMNCNWTTRRGATCPHSTQQSYGFCVA